MGYRRNRKTYKLTFEEFPGLQVTARSIPVGDLLEILQLAGEMGKNPSTEQVEQLFARFAAQIEEWNYEDEGGQPLKPTVETLMGEEMDFVLKLINGWAGAVAGTPDPTTAAANGAAGVAASIPMTATGT